MQMRMLRKSRKGQGLVEYGLLIAGVALVSAAAVSVFGHKTNDLIAAMATVLPGAHSDDNGPIVSGRLIETTDPRDGRGPGNTDFGAIALDVQAIAAASGTRRMGNNIIGNQGFGEGEVSGNVNAFGGLVVSTLSE